MLVNPVERNSRYRLDKWDVVAGGVILVIAVLITLGVGNKTYDDAYITFRYAKNLALGHGFVYNPGENFLGTTTPLFTLLLAALGRLYSIEAIPSFGQWLTGASLFCCGMFIYLMGRTDGKLLGGLVAALFMLLNPFFIGVWGGEALFLLALVLGSYYFYFQGYEALPAILLALAFLTRGEGILPAFVLYGHFILVKKKLPWRAIFAFCAILIPWSIYALLTFGSPLPSTLQAKMAQFQSGFWPPFFRTSLEWLAAYAVKTPHFSHLGSSYLYLIVVAMVALGGLSLLLRPQFRWWSIFIWLGLYTAGYSFLGIPFYRWYVTPLAFGGMVLAGLGAQLGYEWINRLTGDNRKFRITALGMSALGLSLPMLTAANFIINQAALPLHVEYRLYSKTGKWLQEHTPPTASVGYFEIGFMGYYADRKFIDPVGLINPGVAEQVARGDFKWAFRHYKPTYLVIHPARWYNQIGSIREEAWFNRAYQQVATIEEAGYYLNVPLVIYQKVDDAAIPMP